VARPWQGENWSGPTISIPRYGIPGAMLAVPRPIVALNLHILQILTGHDAQTFQMTAMEGYRHQRSTVRLEREEHSGRPVIHNYGHGGAGVTLSWSCAIQVASLTGATEGLCTEDIERLLLESVRLAGANCFK
jgi:D-amino-acid oxidase